MTPDMKALSLAIGFYAMTQGATEQEAQQIADQATALILSDPSTDFMQAVFITHGEMMKLGIVPRS